jgi:adenosylhomocysteine nucleosidase
MRILMVAADPMEFAAFGGTGRTACALDWARTARRGSDELMLVTNGAGKKRAAAAIDAAVVQFAPDAVVSTGFCGALSPALGIADIVVATNVTDGAANFKVLEPKNNRPHQRGLVMTMDHVVQTAAEKGMLHARGAVAVEMEAAGVAGRAEALGLPFYCVRVVTDLAGEDLANDFNQALREDGHFATISILKGTLRKPLVRLPELLRLRNRCARAARALGEFIADCRF